MYSQAEENYLKALYSLTEKNGNATINLISKKLNIKMPTVNSMTKRMLDKGLVSHESYKPVELSAEGKKEAALIIRKHRLTEMFLVEKMGFGWEEVHQIAEQIEHINSPLFFDKMDELLCYPKLDPHGSPIPNKNGQVESFSRVSLASIPLKKQVEFVAVADSSEDFLKFLNKKELQLGALLKIIFIEPFDGSLQVELESKEVIDLSALAAQKILVLKQ